METPQIPLFFDTYEDAIRDTVVALGGNKKVGNMLWPTLPVDEAGRRLAHCLNREKREKLDLDDLRAIRTAARKTNIHTLAAFEMRDAGYADPKPVEPEDERAALQREFVEASKFMRGLFARMERAGLQAVA